MGVYSYGMEVWKPKCHLIWKSNPMGPVANRTYIVEFSQNTITKQITFFEKYTCEEKKKGKIKFHDDHKLHEYQSEDAALKDYLEENPHEVEEVKKQEAVLTLGGSSQDESSDEPETPREDTSMKSNTPLSHASGELNNYKSKYQTEEFQFGMSFSEPEPVQTETEEIDADDMDLRPADGDSTINYTDSSISDMLF